MRNPEITKNTSTPTKPPPGGKSQRWLANTVSTAIIRKPECPGADVRVQRGASADASIGCIFANGATTERSPSTKKPRRNISRSPGSSAGPRFP